MRRHVWIGIIGVVVLAGCDKPKVQSTDAAPVTEAPVQATPPPAVVQATPESTPPAAVASAGPKVDDEVYLVRRISVPIDGGMRGFREGSKVKIVSIEGSKVTVTGNDVQFDVQIVDISSEPPAVQSAPPQPAATTGGAGAQPSAEAAELQKKRERNRITAEISNLEIAANKNTEAAAQARKKSEQLWNVINSGSKGTKSPEQRARIAEAQRLNELAQQYGEEAIKVQRELTMKKRELARMK